MISLTRFHSGERIAINPDQIERIEENPDTIVTMTNGNRHVIDESIDEITDKIRVFRASLLSLAVHMADHPTAATAVTRLRVVSTGPGPDVATAGAGRAPGSSAPGTVEP